MSTPTTHSKSTDLLRSSMPHALLSTRNALSLRAELLLFALLMPLVLFTALIALVHTLSFFVVSLGSPLFTSLTPGAAVIFAALVPIVANPVHALLCLLGLFGSNAVIYLSLGAEYLGLVFTIVYLGAVAILFLYVIMLLNVKDIMSAQRSVNALGHRYVASGFVGGLTLCRLPVSVQGGLNEAFLFSPESSRAYLTPSEELIYRLQTDILSLRDLYGISWPLFMLITLILLLSMLGAIILATGSVEDTGVTRYTKKLPAQASALLLTVTSSTENEVISGGSWLSYGLAATGVAALTVAAACYAPGLLALLPMALGNIEYLRPGSKSTSSGVEVPFTGGLTPQIPSDLSPELLTSAAQTGGYSPTATVLVAAGVTTLFVGGAVLGTCTPAGAAGLAFLGSAACAALPRTVVLSYEIAATWLTNTPVIAIVTSSPAVNSLASAAAKVLWPWWR